MGNDSKNNLSHYTQAPKQKEIVLEIPRQYAGFRLDQALVQMFPEYSRSQLQAAIKQGFIVIDGDGAQAKDKVWGGEKILFRAPQIAQEATHQAEAIPLNIIYEDEALLIINKPPGLVVHPGSGNWQGTMLNALLHHVAQLSDLPRAGIVHRLDKDTSGLLVVAKTLIAQTALVRQLQEHRVKREYLALVHGVVKKNDSVEMPIGRHPKLRTKMAIVAQGKQAITHYQVITRFSHLTLLRCRLETGRTHQIRVHLNYLGHPLVGDPVYGLSKRSIPKEIKLITEDFNRQALHAERLALEHPVTRELMEWQAELPADMKSLLHKLKKNHG